MRRVTKCCLLENSQGDAQFGPIFWEGDKMAAEASSPRPEARLPSLAALSCGLLSRYAILPAQALGRGGVGGGGP